MSQIDFPKKYSNLIGMFATRLQTQKSSEIKKRITTKKINTNNEHEDLYSQSKITLERMTCR